MSEKTSHVSEAKKKVAAELKKLFLEYPIIAAVNMENLPAPQLQQMRAQLRGQVVLTMTKRRIMAHAINEIKDQKSGVEGLIEHLKGMPALIFTKENPFSLYKTLKKSKTSAPAKGGQTAPNDIIVKAGPTPFQPGPIIGELAQMGIKSGVEGANVAIKEDSVAVKAGDVIPQKTAEVLTRLGIEPMEVGLNVTAVYENGSIFGAEVLDIDEEQFMSDLTTAATWAYNLAINSAYTTKDTVEVLLGKAFNDAKALGVSENIIDEGIVDELLTNAERSALNIKSTANIETVDKPKEDKAQEPPKDDKPEEKPVEEKPAEAPKAEEKPTEAPVEEKAPAKEEPKAEEKPAEPPKEEAKEEPKEETPKAAESTEDKVADMVNKTKSFNKGEVPTADDLLAEADDAPEEKADEKPAEKPQESQSENAQSEHDKVADLTKELMEKGTLRRE